MSKPNEVLDAYFEVIGWSLLATSGLGNTDQLDAVTIANDSQDALSHWFAEQMSDKPPEWMAKQALRGIEEAKENGAGTRVGRVRASQLKARKPLSRSVLNRLISFLSRHKGQLNRNQNQERRRTAMALWGGGSKSSAERAISWARGQLRKMDD